MNVLILPDSVLRDVLWILKEDAFLYLIQRKWLRDSSKNSKYQTILPAILTFSIKSE